MEYFMVEPLNLANLSGKVMKESLLENINNK